MNYLHVKIEVREKKNTLIWQGGCQSHSNREGIPQIKAFSLMATQSMLNQTSSADPYVQEGSYGRRIPFKVLPFKGTQQQFALCLKNVSSQSHFFQLRCVSCSLIHFALNEAFKDGPT